MTNDKDCAALLREAMGRMSKFCDEWAKMHPTDEDTQYLHFGEDRQAVLRASDIRTVVAALKSHGQAFDAADKTKSTCADLEGLAYDVHHHWSVGHKDEAVAAILRFCPLVDAAGVREAAQAVIDGMERPGSRAEYAISEDGRETWHDYHEVRDALLNDLQDAIRALPIPVAGIVIPKLDPVHAERHPVLAPIIEKRARAAANFSPEFSGQRGQDFDRGLLCAFEAVNGQLQRMTQEAAHPEPDTIGSNFGNGGGFDPVGSFHDQRGGSGE